MDDTSDHVKLNVKTLFLIAGIMFGTLVTVLGTISVLYLEAKFDGMNARFEGMEKYLEARFDRVDEKFDKVNARIDEHETILNNIRDRVASIEGRMERNSPEARASVAYSPAGST